MNQGLNDIHNPLDTRITVLEATADIGRVYPTDRLFFFEWRGTRYSILAFSSDDVLAQFDFLARYIADIVSEMTQEEAFLAVEAIRRDPLLGLPYYEKAGPADYMGLRRKA